MQGLCKGIYPQNMVLKVQYLHFKLIEYLNTIKCRLPTSESPFRAKAPEVVELPALSEEDKEEALSKPTVTENDVAAVVSAWTKAGCDPRVQGMKGWHILEQGDMRQPLLISSRLIL